MKGVRPQNEVTPLRALAQRLGLRRCDIASISGLGMQTVHRLWHDPYQPHITIGVLVRLAYAIGVSPLELCPGLAYRPAGGPVRLGGDAAISAVLKGERMERVHSGDVREDRLPAPGELLRKPPEEWNPPEDDEHTSA
jgi:transcriptional regulator with XRE-family HTH domain